MFSRRSSLLLLLLPAIGYTFVMYALIGRACKEETYTFFDYEQGDGPQNKQAIVKHQPGTSEKSNRFIVSFRKNRNKNNKMKQDFSDERFRSETASNHASRKPSYAYNCTNISKIRLRKKIGHGVSKQTFLGEYRGHSMAVKMVTRHIHDVKTCLDKFKGQDGQEVKAESSRSQCYVYSTLKLMKEVLLAEQLDHPQIAQLLGYCVRSEETDSTDIAEHGVVSVFELGSRFVLDSLQIMPWPTRLRHALDMADLLHYLQHSPLGSLVIPDFKEGHFILVNSSLKLIDLDDINNIEPACGATSLQGETSPCQYGVACQKALCVGFNAKENLKNMNRLILKRLLFPITFPEAVVREVGQLNAELDLLALSADELRTRLLWIQSKATSGLR